MEHKVETKYIKGFGYDSLGTRIASRIYRLKTVHSDYRVRTYAWFDLEKMAIKTKFEIARGTIVDAVTVAKLDTLDEVKQWIEDHKEDIENELDAKAKEEGII